MRSSADNAESAGWSVITKNMQMGVSNAGVHIVGIRVTAQQKYHNLTKGGDTMTKSCDACGAPAGVSIGGAMLCRKCDVDIRPEIDRLREEGKAVNVLQIARKIFRETHSAGNYILRNIPEDLWKRAKHRAVDEKCSLRDILIKALEIYIKEVKK